MSRSIKSQIAFQEDYVRHLRNSLPGRVAKGAVSPLGAAAKLECAESILATLNKVLDPHPHKEAAHV